MTPEPAASTPTHPPKPLRSPGQAHTHTPIQLYTIGVYGFTEAGFFEALEGAGIDTFCDIRRRRGLRGSEYAFANATRLQQELERRGIRYRHFLELAPSPSLRSDQAAEDKAERTAKRQRSALSPAFVSGFRDTCLAGFDSAAFAAELGSEAQRVVLFCVEREPGACHRSLVAERLEQELGAPVTHLLPDPEASG
jgi:uncharacterized protein (DUF488 family)